MFPNKETDDTKVCLDACGVVGPNQCYRREHHSYPRSAEDGFGPDGGECYVEVTGILCIHYEVALKHSSRLLLHVTLVAERGEPTLATWES